MHSNKWPYSSAKANAFVLFFFHTERCIISIVLLSGMGMTNLNTSDLRRQSTVTLIERPCTNHKYELHPKQRFWISQTLSYWGGGWGVMGATHSFSTGTSYSERLLGLLQTSTGQNEFLNPNDNIWVAHQSTIWLTKIQLDDQHHSTSSSSSESKSESTCCEGIFTAGLTPVLFELGGASLHRGIRKQEATFFILIGLIIITTILIISTPLITMTINCHYHQKSLCGRHRGGKVDRVVGTESVKSIVWSLRGR